MMYGYGGAGWGLGGWIVMAILMVLFWGAVVFVFVSVFRRRTQQEPHLSPDRLSKVSAEQILGERFARGEIDETEYRARRAALRSPE
jgi:putative membrane protein